MALLLQEDAELASRLRELRAYIDDLELEFSRLAAEFEKSRQWEDQGSNSGIDWIRFNCHMTSNSAADRVAVGKADLAESHQAMLNGDIGFAHLAVMARTAKAVGEAFDERALLDVARENSPGKFHYKCLHYRHAVDARAYAGEQDDLAQAAYLHLNRQEDGCLSLVGMLDPAGGAALRAALEPLARRSGAHDHRTGPQRNAHALTELATGGRPANLQVTATIETLKGLAGAAGGDMELSPPISAASVQRMACDCAVTRVLLNQDSVTIDVGRSKRVLSEGLRKALRIRDGHCRWPGCERTASLCHGHHLVHWIDGGETTLGNLVLLCLRHHSMVHEGGWQIIRCDDGKIMTIAPTIAFGLAPPHSWGGGRAAAGGAPD
ncbi:MAG TPA: DUF222 domain-containing protein [Candidatus Dormibacteraeota bacterium]|nr:DUF222 domain-containing protein [Candidatus Dormibacteraeota bacterium]